MWVEAKASVEDRLVGRDMRVSVHMGEGEVFRLRRLRYDRVVQQ